jgi:hypothetical protein
MKYVQRQDGEAFEIPLRRGPRNGMRQGQHRIRCCDCGLVHDFTFVIDKRGGRLAIVAERNQRATAARRRTQRAA